MIRCTAQITTMAQSAFAVIWSARRQGQRAAAAQMPHIQFVDVTLSDTAEAATYHASGARRSLSSAVSARGTSRVSELSV